MDRQFAGTALSVLKGQRLDQALPNPVAGADWRYTLPGGFAVRVLFAVWTFTASAEVGKRYPSFNILDGDGNTRLRVADVGEIAAAGVALVSAGKNLTTAASASNTTFTIQVPDTIIDPGWSIGSSTQGILPADQITGVRLLVEQLIESNPGEGYGIVHHPHIDIELGG